MNAPLSKTDIAQWNHLADIHQVGPLNDRDRACLSAIRDTLAQFGCLDRFGVNLLHKHFDMDADEILVEHVDEQSRKLLTKPVKVGLVEAELGSAVETQWHWQRGADGTLAQICVARCFPGNYESPAHVPQHTGW